MKEKSVFIIAEAGVNHNGDMSLAFKLVDAAAESGADAVKFQTFKADALVSRYAPKAEYQLRTTDQSESQLEMIRRLELSPAAHESLIEYCRKKGIEFMSSPFDMDSARYLSQLGLSRFKVPSGEITNRPYLELTGSFGKPVILSTGMCALSEIEAAIEVLEGSGLTRAQISVLHCNTEYPTPFEDVNLRAMISIRDAFQVEIGYSDHTPGVEVCVAAAALGARILEKHLTLDHNLPGPDHKASLEPAQFAAMVQMVRNIEKAIGSPLKSPSLSEKKNLPIARKSLVAARRIAVGEILTLENVTAKRPGTGISPMRIHEILGRAAARSFEPDECIDFSAVQSK